MSHWSASRLEKTVLSLKVIRPHAKEHYPLVLLLFCISPIIYFSNAFQVQDADDFVPTLISLEHWTPFYWGSSRVGSLAPLLSTPFQSYKNNMLCQMSIHAVAFFISAYLLVKIVSQSTKFNKSTQLVITFLIALTPVINPLFRANFISVNPYGLGFCLFLLGFHCATSSRNIVRLNLGTLLSFLCAWVNPISIIYLVPIIIIKYLGSSAEIRKKLNIYIFLNIFFSSLFSLYGKARGEDTGLMKPTFVWLNQNQWVKPLAYFQLACLILFLSKLILRKKQELKIAIPIFSFSLLVWPICFCLTLLHHIYGNGYAPRYFVPEAMISFTLALIGAAVALNIDPKIQLSKIAPLLIIIALVLNFYTVHKILNVIPFNAPVTQELNSLNKDINVNSVSFAAGNYWYAWPLKALYRNPDDLFVTSLRFEDQYARDILPIKVKQHFKLGQNGICFGDLSNCNQEIQSIFNYVNVKFNFKLVRVQDVSFSNEKTYLVSVSH